MNIDTEQVDAVKKCAKGDEGMKLLIYYGKLSKKAGFDSVPYVTINGVQWSADTDEFFKDVCAAFKNPPEPCSQTEQRSIKYWSSWLNKFRLILPTKTCILIFYMYLNHSDNVAFNVLTPCTHILLSFVSPWHPKINSNQWS